MSTASAARKLPLPSTPLSPEAQLQAGKEIIRLEAAALQELSGSLGSSFQLAVQMMHDCTGCVIVTGMGKAGLVGQKIAATMASVGTRAHFLHPAEAFHGDLGRIHADDVVLMLTQSGETGEVVQLLPSIREFGVPLIAVTSSSQSTVGSAADAVIELGVLEEADALGLAPSTSTTAMIALGDALALVLSRLRGFQSEDFARFHPGGSLGKKLSKVEDCGRPLLNCRVAQETQTTREVLIQCGQPGRRTGAIMLTDAQGKLSGLFTDSDLARLFEQRVEQALDRPIREVMVCEPLTVVAGTLLAEAVELLAERKISELPVVDSHGRPIGLIDVTDVVGWEVESLASNSREEDKTTDHPAVKLFEGDSNPTL